VLGHADPDRIVFYRAPLRKHYPDTELDLRGLAALPRVDIVESYAGADGIGVKAFVEAGAKGLVIASLAPGILPPAQHAALEEAQAAGVLVVYSTRAPGGRVVPLPKHQLKGSLTSDNLTPQKARVLLMLALTQTEEIGSIQRMFDEY
jgi:L-asparaginase